MSWFSGERDRRVASLGAHVGEVVRRATGARWLADDEDADADVTTLDVDVDLCLPDGTLVRPVERLRQRFSDGPDDGVVRFATECGVTVTPPAEPARQPPRGRRRLLSR